MSTDRGRRKGGGHRMANEFDFGADEQAVASTPEDRARAIVACLDLVRADAVDLDIPELDRLLGAARMAVTDYRSEEHTSELPSLMRISSAVLCLKQKTRRT